MPAADWVCLCVYAITFLLSVAILAVAVKQGRSVGPIVVFLGIEVLAVWPALLPGSYQLDAEPGTLAGTGLLAAILVFCMATGERAQIVAWRRRKQEMDSSSIRILRLGLFLLVAFLTLLGLIIFRGMPPLFSGFSSLIDPAGNENQVAYIRESRRELTKGHILLGQTYAGQGIINSVTDLGWQLSVAVSAFLFSNRATAHKWPFVGVWLLAFIFLGSTGARSPIILSIIIAVATIVLTVNLRPRSILISAALGAGIVLLIMPLSKGAGRGGESIVERMSALISRVTDGNGQNNAAIVHLVDSGAMSLQYGGLFFERLSAILPGVNSGVPFALRLTRLAYGGGANVTGYSTPTQFGLMYADFGPAGVLVGYALSGLLMGLLWRFLLRWDNDLGGVLGGVVLVYLGYVSVTGVHGWVTDTIVLLALIQVILLPRYWARLTWRRVRRSGHHYRHGGSLTVYDSGSQVTTPLTGVGARRPSA